VSAVVVGIRFLEVSKCQYSGDIFVGFSWCLFGSFFASCNKVACGVIRFGDSIFMYFFAPNFLKYVLYATGVYCHFVM
jgi:hypothetical protein